MQRNSSRKIWANLLATAAVCSVPAGPALAQDQSSASNGAVETVLVTATRRLEPLQNVPLAVSVMTGDQMREAGLNNLSDITTEVPTLNFRTAASNKDEAFFVRGLGTVSTSPGAEPSVSTVVDGVVLGRQGEATLDLLDVDHVEVLNGPQGTLFGMNASAGVLNIVTKQPTEEFHSYLNGVYNEGNEWRASGGLSGTVVPGEVTANINVLVSHFDGNVTNLWNDAKVNGYDRDGARTKWLFTPTDDLTITVIGDYMHSLSTSPQGVITTTDSIAYPTNAVTHHAAFAAAMAPAVASPDSRTINSDYDTRAEDDNWGTSAQADLTLGAYTLTSITAYRGWDNTQFQDQSRLPQPLAAYPQMHDKGTVGYNQVSQELRLTSPKSGLVDYVAGLFFFKGDDSETYRRDTTTVSGTTSTVYTGIANYGVTNKSYAAYGEGNIHFTDDLTGIAGIRLTKDEVNYYFNRISTSPVPVSGIQTNFASDGSTGSTGVSGRLGLQYQLDAQNMLYTTYSHGYKGPAYNIAFSMLPQDTGVVKPELSNDYEVGSKSQFLGGKMLLNIAAWLDKVADYQVPFYDIYNGSPVTRFINAGKVSTRGIQADLTANIGDGFTLSASGAYTDAHIDEFTCPKGTAASCDVNGKPLTFAPKWKGTIRANYETPLTASLDLTLGTDVRWQSSEQDSINQTPGTIQGGYGIWNAKIGVISDRHLEVNFVIENILDQHYASYLQTFGNGVVRWVPRDDTRYVGINLHVAQ